MYYIILYHIHKKHFLHKPYNKFLFNFTNTFIAKIQNLITLKNIVYKKHFVLFLMKLK